MNRFIDEIVREFPSFTWHFFAILGIICAWVALCGIVRHLVGRRFPH